MDNNIEWICPHCDNKTYTIHLVREIAKSSICILKLFTCNGCSRMFTDPDKFNLISDMDYDKQSTKTQEKYKNEKRERKQK